MGERTDIFAIEVEKEKRKARGPKAIGNNVRMTTTMDFAKDICKDYKQTGQCGYGDNCIYLHDRGEATGLWEVDKEWSKVLSTMSKKRKLDGDGGGGSEAAAVAAEEKGEDGLPFACFSCKGGFIQPVKTRCGHYFCMTCLREEMKKSKRCPVCGEDMGSSFAPARELEAKLGKTHK